ncbi:MAG: hypothetical protein IT435_05205 [Phycisphaerales bacterium]|nr:hypothetical protein [Phycisphaerales bacterium]
MTSGAVRSAMCATLLAGVIAQAGAAVVVYDNSDGTFFWQLGIHDFGTDYPGTFLDITQPPTQSGEQRPGTLAKWYFPNWSSDEPAIRQLVGEAGVQIARTDDLVILPWDDSQVASFPVRDYQSGEMVTSAASWRWGAPYFFHLPFSFSLDEGTPAIGDPAYVGVRVMSADNQWHYGWIYFTEYAWPVMWAYETEANVPIQIPVPGPGVGAGVCVCGLGLSSRRHRS